MRYLLTGLLATLSSPSRCGYNTIQTQDEAVRPRGPCREPYQRRADLIPNLVATVKGFAAQNRPC